MRPYLAWIVCFVLVACQTPQDAEVQHYAEMGTAAGELTSSSEVTSEPSAQPVLPSREVKYQVYDFHLSAKEVAECKATGGTVRLAMFPAPTEYCEVPAADAGKSCSRSTDCSAYCDADTRTCSEWSGSGMWNELDENGQRVEAAQ